MGGFAYFELIRVALNFIASEIKWHIQQRERAIKFKYFTSFQGTKNIIIIGASFGGIEVVRNLLAISPSKGVSITIIEPRSHFNFCFFFPRFSVVKGYEHLAFIPYGPIFTKFVNQSACKQFKHIKGNVQSFTDKSVVMDDNTTLPYDYLVIASGAKQPAPAHLIATEKEDAISELKQLQDKIRDASKIAIIGGGAVGVELATDIKTFCKEKEVTLIHSRKVLLNRFSKKLGELVFQKMTEIGIQILLETRFDSNVPIQESSFDLVIHCVGQHPNSSFVAKSGGKVDSTSKLIQVTPSLHVLKNGSTEQSKEEIFDNIYALGDVADTGGCKMARAAFIQARVIGTNIVNSIPTGSRSKRVYKAHNIEGSLHLTLGKSLSLLYFQTSSNKDTIIEQKGDPEDMQAMRAWKYYGVSLEKNLE